MDTPYQSTKQVASHWGGTRNCAIVHWSHGIKAKGEVRHQSNHFIGVAPAVVEASGLPEPTMVNGVQQSPIEGPSMLYSFDDRDAPERHELQYFDITQPGHPLQRLVSDHQAPHAVDHRGAPDHVR